MSSNLYQDAITDAKRLQEMAEQNAKNKIIEAITPRIRRLIEQELNTEDVDEESLDSDILAATDEIDFSALESPSSESLDFEPDIEDSVEEIIDDSTDKELNIGAGNLEDKKVHVSITVENNKNDEIYEISENMLNTLGKSSYPKAKNKFEMLRTKLNKARNINERRKILRSLGQLKEELILIESARGNLLARQINRLLKENKTMKGRTRRRARLYEMDDMDETFYFEGDEAAAEDLELEDEGAADVDTAAAQTALEDLAAAVGLEVSVAEPGADDAMEDEELEMDDEMGDDEMGDEEMGDEELEISEAMLRRELMRMSGRRPKRKSQRRTSLRESRRRAQSSRRRRLSEEAVDAADNFGGGKAEQEMFIEVDEDTLLNALAEELGVVTPAGGDANKAADNFGGGSAEKQPVKQEAYRRRRARQTATNNKKLQIAEARLRKQQKEINEMNLFNAKLLYVNKLMQNNTLNAKQQRAIVEAIDNAKTLREAKLLYTSLTESLRRRTTSGNNLNEGTVRTTATASKSTQSASPANNGSGLNRWAVLAGLKK